MISCVIKTLCSRIHKDFIWGRHDQAKGDGKNQEMCRRKVKNWIKLAFTLYLHQLIV